MKVKSARELNKLKREGEQQLFPRTISIQVGTAPCGLSKGAKEVVTTLQKELEKSGVDAAVIKDSFLQKRKQLVVYEYQILKRILFKPGK